MHSRVVGFASRHRWTGATALAALMLTACGGQSAAPEVAAEENSAQPKGAEEMRIAVTDCIGAAMQGTVFSNKTGNDLGGAFAAQAHNDCPADFMQQFTVTGEAMRLVVEAQDQLTSHQGREGDAQRRSLYNTANNVLDGQTSDKRPYEGWLERKEALEEALSNAKSTYGQARSALVAIAARYGVYPEQQAIDARATDEAVQPSPTPSEWKLETTDGNAM